jgi:hypothetical protein
MACSFFFVAFGAARWLLTSKHLLAYIFHVVAVPGCLEICVVEIARKTLVIFKYTDLCASNFFIVAGSNSAGVGGTAYSHTAVWSSAKVYPRKDAPSF